jgi:hypothetical protein
MKPDTGGTSRQAERDRREHPRPHDSGRRKTRTTVHRTRARPLARAAPSKAEALWCAARDDAFTPGKERLSYFDGVFRMMIR